MPCYLRVRLKTGIFTDVEAFTQALREMKHAMANGVDVYDSTDRRVGTYEDGKFTTANGNLLRHVTQIYAVRQAERFARLRGMKVQRQTAKDGSIVLTVTR